jgi:tRNA-Thr(GGU) m(6)t(6)A37 methyltransferase TsaA
LKAHVATALTALALGACAISAAPAPDPEPGPAGQFTVHPIGQVTRTDGRTTIVLDRRYEPGLLGLDGFSHAYVLWWFDRNDTPQQRSILQVHPRGDRTNPLTGVFATRAPVRPNLIALTLCRIISVKENVVEIESIDAFAGTPVLDIKPYLPGSDSKASVTWPDWVDG